MQRAAEKSVSDDQEDHYLQLERLVFHFFSYQCKTYDHSNILVQQLTVDN